MLAPLKKQVEDEPVYQPGFIARPDEGSPQTRTQNAMHRGKEEEEEEGDKEDKDEEEEDMDMDMDLS